MRGAQCVAHHAVHAKKMPPHAERAKNFGAPRGARCAVHRAVRAKKYFPAWSARKILATRAVRGARCAVHRAKCAKKCPLARAERANTFGLPARCVVRGARCTVHRAVRAKKCPPARSARKLFTLTKKLEAHFLGPCTPNHPFFRTLYH